MAVSERLVSRRPDWVRSSSRRCSNESAMAPPHSENTSSGTSWTNARSPIESGDCVSTYSW